VHWEQRILVRAASHIANIQFLLNKTDTRPLAQATTDALNPGAITPNGDCKPPTMPMQIYDCLYTNTVTYFPRTVTAIIVFLEDIFGGHHPYQEPPISLKKLNHIHSEGRILVGHKPDTRSVVVKLSPGRADSVLQYLADHNWILPNKQATIREIATVTGIIGSAADYFP